MEREIKHIDVNKPKEENKPLNESVKEVKEVKKVECTTDDLEMENMDIPMDYDEEEVHDYDEEEKEELVDIKSSRFKLGRKVKRGPDWTYGSQDIMNGGCGFGTIVRVEKNSEHVWVQWKTSNGKDSHLNIYPAGEMNIDYSSKTLRRFYALSYVKDK